MYSHVFVAGTFDRFHDGHKAFLQRAFTIGDRVTIGLTSDEFVRRFKNGGRVYLPFAERKKYLDAWIAGNDFENRVTVIAIDDPYEPAVSMDTLDAILVTKDNVGRGEEINTRRAGKGLPELTLVDVPMVPAQDRVAISATRIANGEIDTAGRLVMPDTMRLELGQPLGNILVGDKIGTSIETHRNGIVIAVGDVTTKTILTAGVIPNLSIVDFRVGRQPFPDLDAKFTELTLYRVPVKSGPGYIAREAVQDIQKWAIHPADREAMIVSGEEDLLAIPAIMYAPLGAVMYYGQPNQGLVEVVVTQQVKDQAGNLLTKFQSS